MFSTKLSKRLKNSTAALVAGFAALTATSQANAANIVEVASGAGIFNTLLAAATAAGLADTLQSKGPFTVYAPTDDAFAALSEGLPYKEERTAKAA